MATGKMTVDGAIILINQLHTSEKVDPVFREALKIGVGGLMYCKRVLRDPYLNAIPALLMKIQEDK